MRDQSTWWLSCGTQAEKAFHCRHFEREAESESRGTDGMIGTGNTPMSWCSGCLQSAT